MNKIVFVSGPCGTGKSTFTDGYARHLVSKTGKSVYIIHGDEFHAGFVEPEEKGDFFVNGEAIVLTATEDELERRIRDRGDVDMIERAKFLKRKLDLMPENAGHIYDNTCKPLEEMIKEIELKDYEDLFR